MKKTTIDKINYIIAVITEFADAHKIGTQQSYKYLQENKGIDFIDEFYDVEHTLSFDNVIEDLTVYCHRKGGSLT